jgi:hypothetical protein
MAPLAVRNCSSQMCRYTAEPEEEEQVLMVLSPIDEDH